MWPSFKTRINIDEVSGKFSTCGRAASGSDVLFGFACTELPGPFHVLKVLALFAAFFANWISDQFIIFREIRW